MPDLEERLVPADVAALCRGCPLAAQCLELAIVHGTQGYWAGSTTAQRAQLVAAGDANLVDLWELVRREEQLAARRRMAELRQARHAPGEGGLGAYRRRGCRCPECRRANAENRARQRAEKATAA